MPAGLSVQLYSLREEAKAGVAPVIERLGRIGYAAVEPAGFGDLAPEAFARCVAAAGMVVSSCHVALPKPGAANALLDQQQALGNSLVVVPFLPPERFADAASIDKAAEHLNLFNDAVRARGMRLGYHNHWWEFQQRIDGESAHARLFRQLDANVFAEVDTYWARVGGADPAQVVAALGERARLLHIKDGPADDPAAAMTAVGDGTMDIGAIAAVSHALWHVVELDRCATDMFDAIERSCAYLTTNGFAKGRA
jgi:sugar phosphate isomerase/epimerase